MRAAARALGAGLLAALCAPALAEEITVACLFDGVCDPDRMRCEGAALDLRFRIDTEAGSVAALGGSAASAYALVLGDRALTVVETPISGGTSTTTIPTAGGWSVHSVNGFAGDTIAPKQYFGECRGL